MATGLTTLDHGGNDIVCNNVFAGINTAGMATLTVPTTSVMLPKFEYATDVQNQVVAASYAVSHTIFVNGNAGDTFKVVGVSAVFGTASSSGTLQVEVATGTQAVASGTNQLTGTMSLSGTANTTVNGTVIASPTTITAGSRINLIFAGTVTSLANAVITVTIQRVG